MTKKFDQKLSILSVFVDKLRAVSQLNRSEGMFQKQILFSFYSLCQGLHAVEIPTAMHATPARYMPTPRSPSRTRPSSFAPRFEAPKPAKAQ
nr:hypothetical protein [Thaumasiovibrio subtropicus]